MDTPERDTGLTTAPESELQHEVVRLREQNARLRERCRELEGRVRIQAAERIGAVARVTVAA